VANITTIQLTDTKRDTVAVLNQNFSALNAALSIANRYVLELTGALGAVNITHNLGTRDVVVQLWNQSGVAELAEMTIVDANTIQLKFNQSYSGRVVVL
jgi:hypothetical protein